MKKIFVLVSALSMSVGSASAGYMFGDGSVENTYVSDSRVLSVADEPLKNAGHIRRSDDPAENSYGTDRNLNMRASSFKETAPTVRRLNDGSPPSQDY